MLPECERTYDRGWRASVTGGNIFEGEWIGASSGTGWLSKQPLSVPDKKPHYANAILMGGFGLAAVEGLLLGKPVLCSGAGGLKDIVDESCGAICTTEVEYAAAVDKILQPDVYTVISQNAVERSRKFTDLVAYKNKIENVYDMALGKG